MKTRLLRPFLAVLGAGMALTMARADARREQTIPIRTGWNAVFLEVQPDASKPSELFAGLPVETVACFFPARRDAQYLRNPGDAPWREEGWAVWHAPSRPEAFLSNLHEIQAPRALLIRASADFLWKVTGAARATVIGWHPNTCTLTGLPVDSALVPTFAQFFSGSEAHQRLRIFRLQSGVWKLVRDPASERPQSGEAYWIQTDGASDYQGPLRVKLPASGELDFDVHGGSFSLQFRNESPTSEARVRMETMSSANALPLRRVLPELAASEIVRAPLPSVVDFPILPAGGSATLRLAPHREAMRGASGTTLLRITDGRGTQLWVPVRARRQLLGAALAQP